MQENYFTYLSEIKRVYTEPIKIRKMHRCQGCNRIFPLGRYMWSMKGKEQDSIRLVHFYLCKQCKELLGMENLFLVGDLLEKRKERIEDWRNGGREKYRIEKQKQDIWFRQMIKDFMKEKEI